MAATALAATLAASTSITALSLRHTLLSEDVAEILAQGLSQSRSLRHLDLQGCNLALTGITPRGAEGRVSSSGRGLVVLLPRVCFFVIFCVHPVGSLFFCPKI